MGEPPPPPAPPPPPKEIKGKISVPKGEYVLGRRAAK
jgi:hypothetical protein